MTEDLKSRLLAIDHGDGGTQRPRNPDGVEAVKEIEQLKADNKSLMRHIDAESVVVATTYTIDGVPTQTKDFRSNVLQREKDDLRAQLVAIEAERDRAQQACEQIGARLAPKDAEFERLRKACDDWSEASQRNYQRAKKAKAEAERLREILADLYQCDEWGIFSMDEVKGRARAALKGGKNGNN